MQYHFNGFKPGDPAITPEANKSSESSHQVDVLIIGCGSAGLTLAAQLSTFADINTRIVERNEGPLVVGQADGVACRSMEMFEAFGFADNVKKEAYWVNEVAFWRPDNVSRNTLIRADRIQDVEDGLSEMPHTILNQARIHDFFLEFMHQSPRRLVPDYGTTLLSLHREADGDFPVKAELALAGGATEIVQAKYVVGCDGARSTVREALGLSLKGESARQLWGVMDVLAITDFPDIRLKSVVQSAEQGSLLVIPREGGFMIRLYIELDELRGSERASDRKLSADNLVNKAQAIFSPFKLDVKEVAWWSAYEIGQRVCDVFDDTQFAKGNSHARIFIAGDACHTHSPKAGQGMNVSMADSFNLGWKLASVLRGLSQPTLLNTYSTERQAKARELIEFDKDMARLFSAKPKNKAEAEQFQRYFTKHGRYTAGVETTYEPSLITIENNSESLAIGYPVGKRFHSAPVIRLADARPMELGHVLKADGRWRLIAFAPLQPSNDSYNQILQLCHFLQHDANSPLQLYTSTADELDAVIDFRVVFQKSHQDMAIETLPPLLKPPKGRYSLIDYEKVFCADQKPNNDIFHLRQIHREKGALVVVRPDQFVAGVMALNAYVALQNFFSHFMLENKD